MLWWRGYASSDSIYLRACDESNTGGVLGAFVLGLPFPYEGDTLDASNDYTGGVLLIGLLPDTEYDVILFLGEAVFATVKARTMPETGGKLLFVPDCLEAHPAFANLVASLEADHGFSSEWIYIDQSEYSGAPASAASIPTLRASLDEYATEEDEDYDDIKAAFLASYNAKQRYSLIREGSRSNIWRLRFCQKFPMIHMPDNHEYTSSPTPTPAPGMAMYDAFRQALRNYEDGNNPVNTDEGIDTVPSPTIYCRHRVGDFEVVCLDYTSYSDDPTQNKLDDPDRGGTSQKAWVIDRIQNSTAPTLILWVPSPIVGSEWTDTDTGILAAIAQREGTVIIFSADIHHPFARFITRNGANVLEVGTGTLRQTSIGAIPNISGTVYGSDGTSTAVESVFTKAGREACNWTYATAESDGTNVYVVLRNALTNAVRFSCRIPIGEREPQDIVMDARFAAQTPPA